MNFTSLFTWSVSVGRNWNGLGNSIVLKNCVQNRGISVTAAVQGKRNIRKFFLGNKRGTKIFRRDRNAGLHDDWAPIYTEVQPTGFLYDGVYHEVQEMVPEIVVPELTDFKLKPYVSYKTADIYQSEFTAQDLFDVVYSNKIKRDFEENKLDVEGNPLEPSEAEKMTPDEAFILARKSGSDIFSEKEPKFWECLEKSLIDEPAPCFQVSPYDLAHPSESDKQKFPEVPEGLKRILSESEVSSPTSPK